MDKKALNGSIAIKNPIPDIPAGVVQLEGVFQNSRRSFWLDESILSKNSLIIGGIGCGKTTLFFHMVDQIRAQMTSDDVMIIFDSKGDFYQKFGRPDDMVIGNSAQYSCKSMKWNIYKEILADGMDEMKYVLNINEICKGLFQERVKHTTNAFFPNADSDILAGLLMCIIRDCKNSVDDKKKYFYNDKLKDILDGITADMLINSFTQHQDLNSLTYYIDGQGEQAMGVLSELRSVIRDILVGVFADHGGFSMREFVRNKGRKTLFIEYDLAIGQVLSPVYSLMFDLALKEALGRQGGRNHGNVYLICDEFRLLPNIKHIDDGVNFGRSLGVKVFAGLQSINQLIEVYGEARGKNIAAGFSSVYAFRANDSETRKFITNLFGQNMVLEDYADSSGKYESKMRIGNVIEDWELTALGIGDAFVGLPLQLPFRFHFNNYP